MLLRSHLLYSLTIALIWAGFWWRSGAVHPDWRNIIPQLDQMNIKLAQKNSKDLLREIKKASFSYPSSQSEDYCSRAFSIDQTIRHAMDTIPALGLSVFWEKRNEYYHSLAESCDFDAAVTTNFMKSNIVSPKSDQYFTAIFQSNAQIALNNYKLQLALDQCIAMRYFCIKTGAYGSDEFDRYIPGLLNINTVLVNERIQISVITTGFNKGNFIKAISSPGFPPSKNGVIDTTLTYHSPGIQWIPFLIRYEDKESANIYERHDTLSFRVTTK